MLPEAKVFTAVGSYKVLYIKANLVNTRRLHAFVVIGNDFTLYDYPQQKYYYKD